jgi:hypothetical protein
LVNSKADLTFIHSPNAGLAANIRLALMHDYGRSFFVRTSLITLAAILWINCEIRETVAATASSLSSGAMSQPLAAAGAVRLANSFAVFIAVEPSDQIVAIGGTATFSVSAIGIPPLNYQWLKNGTIIPRATNRVLTVANAQISSVAEYHVAIFNTEGAISSRKATLNLQGTIPPVISAQPTNQTVVIGTDVSFTVAALSLEPLEFQWLKDSRSVTNATNATLLLPLVSALDAGSYAVLITNRLGGVTSASARLEVRFPPSIRTQPTNQVALAGETVTIKAESAGSTPLEHQWFKNGLAIPGATNVQLGFSSIQGEDAGTYLLTVRNGYGSVRSDEVTLTVNVPVQIAFGPTNQTVLAGAPAIFSVEATGTPPFLYQWFRDGVVILGANSRTLTFNQTQPSDAASYKVNVRNPYGIMTSAEATLRINIPAAIPLQPKNQAVVLGSQASFTVGAVGTPPLRYSWFKDGQLIADATDRTLTLKDVRLSDAGKYRVEVTNPFSRVTSIEAILSVGIPLVITTQPQGQVAIAGSNATFVVEASSIAPLSYQWFKNEIGVVGGNDPWLRLNPVKLSDAGQYRVLVSSEHGGILSSNALLVVRLPPSLSSQPQNRIALPGTNVLFSVDASGDSPLSYQWFKDGQSLAQATNRTLVLNTVQLSDAGNYSVVVINPYGMVTSSAASLTLDPLVIITRQPANQRAKAGTNVSFTIEASSIFALNYQWLKNDRAIPGATGKTLLLREVTDADNGIYKVEVSNALGRATSAGAILSVEMPSAPRSDLNGDGWPDLVFQDNQGFVASWFLRGATLVSSDFLNPRNVGDVNWRIVGAAKFTISDNPGLLFQHSSGALAIWTMKARALNSVASLELSDVTLRNWRVAGAGDFDLDGKTDLALQHVDGTLAVSYLNGVTANSPVLINPNHPGDAEWRVNAVADFDRDGHDDLIFQHRRDGTLVVWFLTKNTLSSALFLNPRDPGDPRWRLAGAADFNRDDKLDLLFQHELDGRLAVWLMDGLSLMEARFLEPEAPGGTWRVVSP